MEYSCFASDHDSDQGQHRLKVTYMAGLVKAKLRMQESCTNPKEETNPNSFIHSTF